MGLRNLLQLLVHYLQGQNLQFRPKDNHIFANFQRLLSRLEAHIAEFQKFLNLVKLCEHFKQISFIKVRVEIVLLIIVRLDVRSPFFQGVLVKLLMMLLLLFLQTALNELVVEQVRVLGGLVLSYVLRALILLRVAFLNGESLLQC